jgi:hypothetical protein
MLIKQAKIEPDLLHTVVEQKIAAGSTYDGALPADAIENFTPFYDDATGIWRMGKPDGSTFEGIHGGLFVTAHTQPMILDQVLADFGTSLAYTLFIVTSAGEIRLLTGTTRYLVVGNVRWRYQQSEKLKLVVAAGTAAMWARMYLRSAQTRTA